MGTKVLKRDVNKWKTVADTTKDSHEEEDKIVEVVIGTIFEENAVDDPELWRALLMKDRVSFSEKLESSSVIASNLSDKPKDYVADESLIRRDTYLQNYLFRGCLDSSRFLDM